MYKNLCTKENDDWQFYAQRKTMTGNTFLGLSFGVQNLKKKIFSERATLMLASLVDRGEQIHKSRFDT